LSLFDGFLPFLLTHMFDADFLDDKKLSGLFLFDQVSLTEGSLPKQFLFLIDLVLTFEHSDFHLNIKKYRFKHYKYQKNNSSTDPSVTSITKT
jgi:hypothetical protein